MNDTPEQTFPRLPKYFSCQYITRKNLMAESIERVRRATELLKVMLTALLLLWDLMDMLFAALRT